MTRAWIFEGVLSENPVWCGAGFRLGEARDPIVVDEGYTDRVTFYSIDVEYNSELAKHAGERVRLRACVDEHYEQHSLDGGYTYSVKVRCLAGVRLITALEKNDVRPTDTEEFLEWWKRNIERQR